MEKEKEVKELIQEIGLVLNDVNKAKLKSLKIFENQYFNMANGWVDLVYNLGKDIEDLCKLANIELPKIEYLNSKNSSLRLDYHFTTPVPKIVEKLIDSLIYEAEDKSEHICMFCGNNGTIDEDENGNLILKSCRKCTNNKTTPSSKYRINRENWYADELLELVAHIQEHAKNKDITKAEYCEMLDSVIRRANLIKDKMLEDNEIVIFNPKDYENNCFDKQPNTDKPSIKTVSNIIRRYLGTMNKKDIHTLCEKFGKDRVFEELDEKFKELFKIGYFEVKGGMRIPLTGDYKEYEMYQELLDMINSYKIINKKTIVNYLNEHFQEFKERYDIEKIGLFGSYARDEATDESDIDIFVIKPPKMFDTINLKHRIEEDLGKEVDIIRKHGNIRPQLLKSIERDVIYADENFVKLSGKNEIINKLKELKTIYLKEGIEILGLHNACEDKYWEKLSYVYITYKMNESFRKNNNGFQQAIRLTEIKKELESFFQKKIELMPFANLKNTDDLILI